MHTDVHSTNPGRSARTRSAQREGRGIRGVLLFGYFLLHKQEKVTRSAEGRVKALFIAYLTIRV